MSVTAPGGFVAAGIAAGIKPSGDLDLSLVATTDGPVAAAATFTRNLACAGPVTVSRRHMEATGGQISAVVLNSGNANCATPTSEADALTMAKAVAHDLGVPTEQVLVCSTGLIGIDLPMDVVAAGLSPLVAARAPGAEAGAAAARAIMTTDTRPKEVQVEGPGFVVGGMAKGAAMLAPNMATMLAVLTTDAVVEDQAWLAEALRTAVDDSFNRLTVDGCTSTNDTVIVLASGESGVRDDGSLASALNAACFSLAKQMNDDAEGATHSITITVTGAASDEEAERAVRKVANSRLVSCSFYGNDPYWGRVLSELGTAEVAMDLAQTTIAYGGVVVSAGGVEIDHDREAVAAHMRQRQVSVTCDLGVGSGTSWVLTNDLTHGYVDENMGTS